MPKSNTSNAFNIAHKHTYYLTFAFEQEMPLEQREKKIVLLFYFTHFFSGTVHRMMSCDRTHIRQLHPLTSVTVPK